MQNKLTAKLVEEAYERVKNVAYHTPLELSKRLSEKYAAKVYLKREDLQVVRSYKLRGAYNKIALLTDTERMRGVFCASAGNHAQGVAFSCASLKIKGFIFMPKNTPRQKIDRVHSYGGKWAQVELVGDTYDEACHHAQSECKKVNGVFVHPFDDVFVSAGQGTVALELLEQLGTSPDFVVVPVGGGGLLAGVGTYLKEKSPKTKLVGVEPKGAPSMSEALKVGKPTTLTKLEKFVDGAAVKTVGALTFLVAKKVLDQMITVDEGKVCEEMISLYQNDGIVAEPAGALSVAALDSLKDLLIGKTVVCVISGGNNDISRYPEVIERSLIYKGLKHYFLLEFPQRPGALREYLDTALGKNDDITLFEYVKKNNRETGPVLVGVELSKKEDLKPLLKRMDTMSLKYEVLDKESSLFRFLV